MQKRKRKTQCKHLVDLLLIALTFAGRVACFFFTHIHNNINSSYAKWSSQYARDRIQILHSGLTLSGVHVFFCSVGFSFRFHLKKYKINANCFFSFSYYCMFLVCFCIFARRRDRNYFVIYRWIYEIRSAYL